MNIKKALLLSISCIAFASSHTSCVEEDPPREESKELRQSEQSLMPGGFQCSSEYEQCSETCDPNSWRSIDFCCVGDLLLSCEDYWRDHIDTDHDGVTDSMDNCPGTFNSNQQNSDGDSLGDACDNCIGIDNPKQRNSDDDPKGDLCDNCPLHTDPTFLDTDQDGVGDVCDWDNGDPTLNTHAMATGAPTCSLDSSRVENCINLLAPPPPSLNRGISTARSIFGDTQNTDHQDRRLPIDDVTTTMEQFYPWGPVVTMDPLGPGKTQTLPFARSTNDGRLLLTGGSGSFDVHYPEVVGLQNRTQGQPALPSERKEALHQHVIFGQSNHTFTGVSGTICDVSSSEFRPDGQASPSGGNPRACETTDSEQGDCYDFTFLTTAHDSRIQPSRARGLYSVDLTLFVQSPKSAHASIPSYRLYAGWPLNARVFPKGETTPDLHNIPLTSAFNRSNAPKLYYTNDCACESLNGCNAHQEMTEELFELTTTADGNLLIANVLQNGVSYAVAQDPERSCQADQFTLFKPLSCLPSDSRTAHYGLAKSAQTPPSGGRKHFIDSMGNPIPPGQHMPGAYMWIDRKGTNMLWSEVTDYRDGWYAQEMYPPTPKNPPSYSQAPDLTYDRYPDQNQEAAGNGVVALGAWTQGKIVVMDNLLNPTDWTGGSLGWSGNHRLPYKFNMALYQGSPRWIRPYTSAMVNSTENQLNHFNSQSPTLPFDVVWRFGTTTNHNAEVVFDEYMLNNAFIVAHMNAPHTSFNPSMNTLYPDDGFMPKYNDCGMRAPGCGPDNSEFPLFRFKRTPKLQNAATSWDTRSPWRTAPPSHLRLRGGARVEPVALGGVRGKGVYLDGENDHILTNFSNIQHKDWFYGIWLDSRDDPSESFRRTIFSWHDGSSVSIRHGQIYIHDNFTQSTNIVTLPYTVAPSTYFHFGLSIKDKGHHYEVAVYFNGTLVDTVIVHGTQGFSMSGTEAWFSVGSLSSRTRDIGPWKGWVDELRVYALNRTSTDHFDEFICNLAMGSLRLINGQAVCEQLTLDAQGHPVDTPAQNGLLCADKVHQGTPDPSCLRTQKHGVSTLVPLDPLADRPDFQSIDFCLSCHIQGHPMRELDILHALSPGTSARYEDPRRQPMDPPGSLYGQLPYPGIGLVPQGFDWSLDYWLSIHGKL